MAKEFSRLSRLAEQLKREIGQRIQGIAREKGLGIVSVNAVRLTPDLREARVYYTCLAGTERQKEITQILNAVSGLIRHELGKELHLKIVPHLVFFFDEVEERGARIDALIDAVMKKEDDPAEIAREGGG